MLLVLLGCAIGFSLATSCLAHASERTFSCDLVEGTDRLRFSQADQFVVDVEAEKAGLRVARTMGTSDPVNWLFETRKDTFSDDRFSVKAAEDGTIVGGGIYGAGAQAFELQADGTLTWSTVIFGRASSIRWKCRP